ncbi:MAG: permease, partial [Candidatus Bathyarchaeia archaeon]
AVIIAALIGVPLYVSIIPVIPIVYSLYLKGLSAGAVIAFLITATAISPPELIMLSGMFKKKFIAFFIIMMILGSIVTGYLLNAISWGV